MARSTEKVALKLMKAFAAEHAREPNPTKCKKAVDIAHKICKSQEEFNQVMEFLGPRRKALINAWRSHDGLSVQPNEAGYEWIASHEEKWTLDRRLVLYGLIWAVLLTGVGLLVRFLTQ